MKWHMYWNGRWRNWKRYRSAFMSLLVWRNAPFCRYRCEYLGSSRVSPHNCSTICIFPWLDFRTTMCEDYSKM